MKRLIIYDLDGTLVDTREDIARAANHMRSVFGMPPLPSREIEGFVGKGLHHLVQGCLGIRDAARTEKGVRIYRDHYAEHMLDHSRLYPGVREILEHFKSRIQVVLTNKPDPFSTRLLEALGVAGYFFRIIAGNSTHPKKPDPDSLRVLFKETGVWGTDSLLIGDSPIDIEVGRAAGVTTVVLTHGFCPENELKSLSPDFMMRDFSALLETAKCHRW